MADTFNKKERAKKKRKKQQEKEERRLQKRNEEKKEVEIMYVDEYGNFTPFPPEKSKVKAEDINIGVPKKDEEDEEGQLREGRVKFFNEDKGYGFIIDRATNESIFVHAENLNTEIFSNDKVVFERGMGPKGPVALNVSLA